MPCSVTHINLCENVYKSTAVGAGETESLKDPQPLRAEGITASSQLSTQDRDLV